MNDLLLSIVRDFTVDDSVELTRDTSFVNELGMSSFDILDFGLRCETVFGISISNEEFSSIKDLGDIDDLIKQKSR